MKEKFIAVLELFEEDQLTSPLAYRPFSEIKGKLQNLNLDKTTIYYRSPDFEGKAEEDLFHFC